MKNITLFTFAIMVSFSTFSQDASQFLNPMMNKWNRIKDYTVDIRITSHIPLIKSFPVKATIYFKQKDQFKMIAKGIAILPKQNFNELPIYLNQKDRYNAFPTGEESIEGTITKIITILPKEEGGDIVLVKLWIDPKTSLLLKSQNTTRSNGTITGYYHYETQKEFGLPDQLTFSVDVNKFKIPKGLATDINRTNMNADKNTNSKEGKIILQFNHYRINGGINDAIFR